MKRIGLQTRYLFTACMIAALLLPLMAPAAKLLQPPRRWFDTPGTAKIVIVDSGGKLGVDVGDGGVANALSAVEAWNSAGLVLDAVSGNTGGITLGDTESHMSFTDPFNVCKGLCLAATFTGFYNANVTGSCNDETVVEIEDSDIVFNNSGPFGSAWTSVSEEQSGGAACSGEVFLETVVTHEVGHLIGLGHEDSLTAVMNSSIAACVNQLLTADDLVDGRDRLYDCTLTLNTPCESTCDGIARECGEVCDGSDLGPEGDCVSQGFPDGGTLGCNSFCTAFDISGCTSPICDLFPVGDSCELNRQCCSNKCRGRTGNKSCK